jgi:hypothetical protein
MSISVFVYNFRQALSEGIISLQVFLMEQYGSFDEQGNYTAIRPVPFQVNQLFRALGHLGWWLKR